MSERFVSLRQRLPNRAHYENTDAYVVAALEELSSELDRVLRHLNRRIDTLEDKINVDES